MTRPCEVCREPAPTCEHNATYCDAHDDGCLPCTDERDTWASDAATWIAEAEHYDALIGEQQADDWAIDARREGL